jgi:hypothetical protein
MCHQACTCVITVIYPISPCQSNSCLTFSTKQLSTHYPFRRICKIVKSDY